MYKKITGLFLVGFIIANSIYAFSINNALSEQVDDFEGTALIDSQVRLADDSLQINDLFINPYFPTRRDMYLSTDDGIYMNRQYNADWFEHEVLSKLFPHGFEEMKFDGKYSTSNTMLVYSSDKIYISYNNGDGWNDITPELDESILFADLGPDFGQNRQIYFITESGLYRKSMSTNTVNLVLESTTPGSVKHFEYVRTQSSSAVFYVVKGSKILKTENFGNTFYEHDFGVGIRDFTIKQKTLNDGHLMVLTEDNKIHYATMGFNFFELNLPEEINLIYAVDYIILTDQGFYITYNDGKDWSKLKYDPAYVYAVTDYDFALDGTQKSFFVVNDGNLYRDYDLTETFEEYMGGLDDFEIYLTEGTATSKNLLELADMQFAPDHAVTKATLSADGELNDQTMTFYLTADGVNWEEVVNNQQHTFQNPGLELKWKVEMSTDDTSVTPVLNSVSIDYGVEKMENCAGFTDIEYSDPHCPAIKYVKEQGIFEGYPDGTFGIDLNINRAETVKVITEGFDYEILQADGTDLGFSDVGVNEWYMGYLKTAYEEGIIEGYPDGTFRPAETVIYAEMLKIFFETAGIELDEPQEDQEWYQPYVDYADANDLVKYDDVSIAMKRADVAELFYQWSLISS